MLRISRLLKKALDAEDFPAGRARAGHVIIWNLTNRCNLSCYHCYADARLSASGRELSTQEARSLIDDLARHDVLVLILSGGEPTLRHDLYELAAYAREKGIGCALSTNGTLLDEAHVENIIQSGINYVGISIDGTPEKHDEFRRKQGACATSLRGMRLCRDAGIKVGLRFSLTSFTAPQLPWVFSLFERANLSKFYISHMNYSDKTLGRMALEPGKTREAMNIIVRKAMSYLRNGSIPREIVTGNNEADAPFLILSIAQEDPGLAKRLHEAMIQDRARAAGIRLVNIDPLGNVHPDPFCRDISLGNVRARRFRQILAHPENNLMDLVRQGEIPFKGRCGKCRFVDLCKGNSRGRAFAQSENWWGSDPLCYLKDEEIVSN